MNPCRRLVAAALLSAFALGANGPVSAAAVHQHGAGAPAKLALDHGKKWATDEPLRKGMGEIRALLAGRLAAIHGGKLTSDEYKALGAAATSTIRAGRRSADDRRATVSGRAPRERPRAMRNDAGAPQRAPSPARTRASNPAVDASIRSSTRSKPAGPP